MTKNKLTARRVRGLRAIRDMAESDYRASGGNWIACSDGLYRFIRITWHPMYTRTLLHLERQRIKALDIPVDTAVGLCA